MLCRGKDVPSSFEQYALAISITAALELWLTLAQ